MANGNSYHSLGGSYGKQKLLNKWKNGNQSTWKFTVNASEVNSQLLKKRKSDAIKLENEVCKRQKFESENKGLKKVVKKQAKKIASLQSGTSTSYRQSSKSWSEYSQQQKYNIKKKLAKKVATTLSFCDENNFELCHVVFKNTDKGTLEKLDVLMGEFTTQDNCDVSDLHTALYVS